MILGYFHKRHGSSLASFVQQWHQVKAANQVPSHFSEAQAVLGQDDAGGHGKQPCHGREGLITVVLGMQFGICYDEICRSQHGKAAYMTKIRNFNCNDHHATCPWGRELAFAFRGLIMTYYSIYIYIVNILPKVLARVLEGWWTCTRGLQGLLKLWVDLGAGKNAFLGYHLLKPAHLERAFRILSTCCTSHTHIYI